MWVIGIKLLVYSAMLVGMVVVLHPTKSVAKAYGWMVASDEC